MNPPLGLCYISAFLKKHAYQNIQGLDYSLYKEYDYNKTNYLKKIPLDGNFYGVYSMTCQYYWLKQVIKYIKRKNPKAKIIVGGPHSSTCPEECLRDAGADIAIKGEGEEAFLEIVSGNNLSKIKGACYLTKDGNFVESERAFIKDLDSLPFPDLKVFNIKKYKRTIHHERALHIVTLRGCPYSCAFCDKKSVGRNVRYRSVKNVMAEIDSVISEYGIKSFVIYDDIFTLNRQRAENFCDEFKKRNLKWRCWSRANTIDEKILQRMKDSGLVSMTFGIESGDDNVLKNINKQTTYEINKQALSACKKVGIPVRCSLMYGNPGENLKSIKNTLRLVAETQPDEWNLAILAPIPGSAIWDNPEKYGVIFNKKWVKKNNYKMTNRFNESGIGSIWISLRGLSKKEMRKNLDFFVRELEKVCPRKNIQDTIQSINVKQVKMLK